jgi:hypothetical protein
MLISSNVDVLTGLLEEFRPCFSKPQFRNFSTYTLGLIACEGKKNIDTINRCFLNAKDQSSLNRFLTQSPWNLQKLEEKRLSMSRCLPVEEGSTGYLLVDDTINRKTGKHMEEAGYHFDSAQGKAVWGHDIVTTHYVNGETEYPVRLSLYVKKKTCQKEQRVFKTKIQLANEQIEAFMPPAGTNVVVAFDSWFFCRQIVEAVAAKGWDWVTQAESNRLVCLNGEETNVTALASGLLEKQFKTVKVKGEEFSLCGFEVWMSKVGSVKMVVAKEKEEDGFHFYVSNRLDWSAKQVLLAYKVRQSIDVFYRDAKQNLGLEAYQMRRGRGAIIHWHLAFNAYTLLALLRRSACLDSRLLRRCLATLGDVCRYVKDQCFRRLVDWIYQKFKHQAKPETIYRQLKI